MKERRAPALPAVAAIRPLATAEAPPWPLLLLADPSEAMVRSYLDRGRLFVAEAGGRVVGEYVLLPTRPATAELVNVAVDPAWQGRGVGKRLVMHAIATARADGYRTLELGTGNAGIGQLALYQRCGFRVVGVDLDFFTRHYPEPIEENGIPCRDMIRLSLELAPPD
jgi:ribosomal protein S18 acetylase RimI-like enzyme